MTPKPGTEIPDAKTYRIKRARVPVSLLDMRWPGAIVDREGSALIDLHIQNGRIADIGPASSESEGEAPVFDADGRQLWPALSDMHTHLDKSQIIGRIGPLGTSFANARAAINADRQKNWNRDDIYARMDFSIRCAFANGTFAIRTHIDSYEGQAEASWEVFAELQREWSGRVTLQAACLVPLDVYTTDYGKRLADLASQTEGGLLGGVLRHSNDADYSKIDNVDELLDAAFSLAKERGMMADLHVDETTREEVFHLPDVAWAAMRHGMEGRAVASHCCSLAVQRQEAAKDAIGLCAEAGVAIASDNVRDTFFQFGDYDLVDIFRQSVPLFHLDRGLGEATGMLGPDPARLMGLEQPGLLKAGSVANLIIFQARSLNEIVCRPQTGRIVIHKGKALKDALPPFPSNQN